MAVKVVTDSTADLPPEAIKEFGINIVPAYIAFEGKTFRDGVDITQDEIYYRMVELNQTATTSQPPPSDFADVYKRLLKEADEIISIQVTSKLSGIYNSAVQAKKMVDPENRITVIDSESVSMGLGLVTLMAARLARAGENLSLIADEVRQNITVTHIWAAFDTLKYLHRGGRIGKAKALFGSVLNIKPLLTMRGGEIHPLGISRTRNKAIDKLAELTRDYKNIEDMAVVHSTTPQDAQNLKNRLQKIHQGLPVTVSRLGPALGVHGGPGAIVLALREKAGMLSDKADEAGGKKYFNLPNLPEFKLPKLRFASL